MRLKNKPYMVIILLAIALCSTSCRSSRTTTVTQRSEAKTEQTQEKTRVDDVTYVHDSVYVIVTAERTEVTRWRTRWRDRTVHDTVMERVTDTIRETNTVEKVVQVPRKGSGAGWLVAIILFLIIVVYILIKTLLKR